MGIGNGADLYEKCSAKELSRSEQFQEFRNVIVITK
jgi:hypothetical protein